MKEQQWAIGIDLGGTKIEIAAVNTNGEILYRERIPTLVKEGPKAIVNEIKESVKKLQKQMINAPIGAGVGVAGQIDPINGMVHFAPNLEWHDIPFRDDLMKAINMPVAVTNDVRAATWGEWLHGAGKGSHDIVCLFIGTGIGGGIVSNGQILVGKNNTAGELGHMTIDLNGPSCTCGNWGCLEALASGWAIARHAQKALLNEMESDSLIEKYYEEQEKEVSARMVIQAFRAGDLLAARIIGEAFQALIAGAVNIVNAFNPEKLILGGGIVEGLPEIMEEINRGVRQRALSAASQSLQVLPAQLKNDAGVIGAALFGIHTIK